MEAERIRDAKDRAHGVALLAAILTTRNPDLCDDAPQRVLEARELLAAAYAAEGLPSPFPAATPEPRP